MAEGVAGNAGAAAGNASAGSNSGAVNASGAVSTNGQPAQVNGGAENAAMNNSANQVLQNNDKQAFGDLFNAEQPVNNPENQNADNMQTENQLPDHYDFFTENGDPENPELVSDVQDIFKNAKLNQEQANTVFAAYKDMIGNIQNELQNSFKSTTDNWYQQTINDPELGGQNLQNTKLAIGAVMQKFGNPELSKYLNETGLGFNPAFVRFMKQVGKAIGNDSDFISGVGATQESAYQRDQRMYPKSPELWGK